MFQDAYLCDASLAEFEPSPAGLNINDGEQGYKNRGLLLDMEKLL